MNIIIKIEFLFTFLFSLWFSFSIFRILEVLPSAESIVLRSSSTVFVKLWFSISNFNNLLEVNSFTSWPKDFCGAIISKNMSLVNYFYFLILKMLTSNVQNKFTCYNMALCTVYSNYI